MAGSLAGARHLHGIFLLLHKASPFCDMLLSTAKVTVVVHYSATPQSCSGHLTPAAVTPYLGAEPHSHEIIAIETPPNLTPLALARLRPSPARIADQFAVEVGLPRSERIATCDSCRVADLIISESELDELGCNSACLVVGEEGRGRAARLPRPAEAQI